ncbi:MAG: UbiX family flavin prenyltransferase [Syntrophobacteria bacterium]
MGERMIVGISGASGAMYGIRALQVLAELNWETHLVVTRTAVEIIRLETDYTLDEVQAMASAVHENEDLTAPIASGSFRTRGMLVAPCSIKSLSAVANSYSDSLLARAADVTLKERRPLVLMVRETPLHRGHLHLMTLACEAGAIMVPPIPYFYSRPQTLAEMIDQIIGRALTQLGIHTTLYSSWEGQR